MFVSYKIDGVRVPRVSTILELMSKPRLIDWAWRMGVEGKDYKEVRDKEGNVGTIAHKLISTDLLKTDIDISIYPPANLDRAYKAFTAWNRWCVSNVIEPIAVEEGLTNRYLMVGGTPDLIARKNDKYILIDFKTSSGNEIYKENIIQACVYAYMWEQSFINNDNPYLTKLIEEIYIFKLGKDDGSLTIHEIPQNIRNDAVNLFYNLRCAYELLKKI